MSTDIPTDDTQEPTEGAQVIDEENRIDKRLKDRILDARERVTEREDHAFVGAPLDDDVALTHSQRTQIWATSVKQYLRVIEPLLRSDEISNSGYYYTELPIVQRTIYPPDGPTTIIRGSGTETDTIEIAWSMLYDDDIDTMKQIMNNPLFGRGFESPEPKTFELSGLKDVIEKDGISVSWRVPLSKQDIDPDIAQPVYETPLKKEWLEFAVRKADQFLQQAGIGLEIGDPSQEADADYTDIVDVDGF